MTLWIRIRIRIELNAGFGLISGFKKFTLFEPPKVCTGIADDICRLCTVRARVRNDVIAAHAQVVRHLVGGLLHHRDGDCAATLGRLRRLQPSRTHF
jgi:hypothetical protein